MWKKSESGDAVPETKSMPVEPVFSSRPAREAATIGPSISIRGDVSGEEDLIVQGQVEGTVTLKQNNVTVGKEGRIKANVHARVIEVEGQVEGDLHGDEQVVVRKSGDVRGNVVAPRITLEDGCKFKGSIDMDVETKEKRASEKVSGIKSAQAQAQAQAQPGDKKGVREEKRGPQWKAENQASGS